MGKKEFFKLFKEPSLIIPFVFIAMGIHSFILFFDNIILLGMMLQLSTLLILLMIYFSMIPMEKRNFLLEIGFYAMFLVWTDRFLTYMWGNNFFYTLFFGMISIFNFFIASYIGIKIVRKRGDI